MSESFGMCVCVCEGCGNGDSQSYTPCFTGTVPTFYILLNSIPSKNHYCYYSYCLFHTITSQNHNRTIAKCMFY